MAGYAILGWTVAVSAGLFVDALGFGALLFAPMTGVIVGALSGWGVHRAERTMSPRASATVGRIERLGAAALIGFLGVTPMRAVVTRSGYDGGLVPLVAIVLIAAVAAIAFSILMRRLREPPDRPALVAIQAALAAIVGAFVWTLVYGPLGELVPALT
ncbi:MAG: hypothetical protein EPO00_04775 [Chloroflexota bacterium]|nr:MAG: hypothetical protein EPO00_04775 [Chloroflexota bacterium]